MWYSHLLTNEMICQIVEVQHGIVKAINQIKSEYNIHSHIAHVTLPSAYWEQVIFDNARDICFLAKIDTLVIHSIGYVPNPTMVSRRASVIKKRNLGRYSMNYEAQIE